MAGLELFLHFHCLLYIYIGNSILTLILPHIFPPLDWLIDMATHISVVLDQCPQVRKDELR
jgi:hypothetical protein